MTAKSTIDGDKITVEFSYKADTSKVQEVIGACAEHLWKDEMNEENEVTNPFDEATNQEKLDVVDKHVKAVLLNMANAFISNKQQKIAREEAESNKLEI